MEIYIAIALMLICWYSLAIILFYKVLKSEIKYIIAKIKIPREMFMFSPIKAEDISIGKDQELSDSDLQGTENENKANYAYEVFREHEEKIKHRGKFYWVGEPYKSAVLFSNHETFPLDKNGNGGC